MIRNTDSVEQRNARRLSTPRGFACIGLHEPKNVLNVGSALRAAGCYKADFVAVSGKRYAHSATDTQKTWKHIPLFEVDDLQSVIPKGCIPVAVDLVEGATSLVDFVHPERAFYIFGGEDRTLDESVLKWCKSKVFVPTSFCMNLAACVNVVLYDRLSKQGSGT